MPRLKHIHVNGYPYFVTAKTIDEEIFSNTESADILLSCIYYGRKEGWYLLLSFAIMPDHMHIIIVPKSKNISQTMKSIKGYSARMINLTRRDRNVPPIQVVENVPPIQVVENVPPIQVVENVPPIHNGDSQELSSGNSKEQNARDSQERSGNSQEQGRRNPQQQDRRNPQQQDRRGFLTPPQAIWQEGFYDYILDSEDRLWTKIKYIEDNPVRKGLVSKPELYPYSSAYKQNLTDLDMYLNGDAAGQACPRENGGMSRLSGDE